MADIIITKKQARTFLLLKHGLLGTYKFKGKQGIVDLIKQVGCIQYDPIDVCGRSPELVLLSRVKGYQKQMLYDLLYHERQLIDYFDKNLAIFSAADWPYFIEERCLHQQAERSHAEILTVCDVIKEEIRNKGALCSADLKMKEKVNWYWSETSISRAALEHMYFKGELMIHHKRGTLKYYDLACRCMKAELLKEENPFKTAGERYKWHVLRRIRSVGLLWNRASDAWLGIHGLKTKERNECFKELLAENKIIEVCVEGVGMLYCAAEDAELLAAAVKLPRLKKRCGLLAPLDNLLWDRKLIKALFDFDYKWEIYTPENQRKFGYYCLPILYGDCLIGRIEAIYDRKIKKLFVKQIWLEEGVKETKTMRAALDEAIIKLEQFNVQPLKEI